MIALKDAATPKNLAWTKAPARVTVNSVTQVTRGAPGFSSVVEAWWPYRDAIGDIAGRDDIVFNIVLDEVVYQPHGKRAADPLPAGYLKTIGAYGLPPTVDGDAFWRYHTEIHGVDVMNAAGDLLMEYSLNRRAETLAGAPGFFAMIEMWWANQAARDGYPARADAFAEKTGINPRKDYASRGPISEFMVVLKEADR